MAERSFEMARGFEHYRVVETLHASARSVVERAVRTTDGATIVLKRAADRVTGSEATRRVRYELELLSSVACDDVIAVASLVEDGGRIALELESFGAPLASRIADGPVPLDEVLDIAICIARGLAVVHAAGIVHRDINPSNIVYDAATRRAKIIDFDIASRTRAADGRFVAPAALEGTLRYMAPEQTGRLARPIDERTDLYSLGATLYELASGQPPFAGDNAAALVHAHLATRPARLADVPPVVADLVARLLDKAPERRYRTARGLLADLVRCREALRDGAIEGTIESFALGAEDVLPVLELGDRLFGRSADVRALLDGFGRAARGGAELVLVAGPSGIGKSALVREIYASVTTHRGYFAAGKYEQLGSSVPYSAVVAALTELVDQIVGEPDVDAWSARIRDALGADLALVQAVLPALAHLLGPAPARERLEADAERRRLVSALGRFVGVFARRAHPLVLFLDDLQWADSASLQLVLALLTTTQPESLLFVLAYRETEVDADHAFAVVLRDAEKRGARPCRITLAPLGVDDTTELVADALRRPPADVAALGERIWQKTGGSPLFVRRFLQVLSDEGRIVFEPATQTFTLDAAALEAAAVTDNVADLLARELAKLPADARELLAVAAAIGGRFDVSTLAAVAEVPPREAQRLLAAGVVAGMVVPGRELACIEPDVVGPAQYTFQHDRVQEAAYALATRRDALHLAIGRVLETTATAAAFAQNPFDVLRHLALGMAAMTDAGEQMHFVDRALVAAVRARDAGAADTAARLLAAARGCEGWRRRGVAIQLHLELARSRSLSGNHAGALAALRVAATHADDHDAVAIAALEASICVRSGDLVAALASGRRAAQLLGVALPADPAALGEQIGAELGAIFAALDASPIEAWLDRPAMTDPDALAAMAVLVALIPAAYQLEPPLMVLIAAKLVTLSARHGISGETARGFAVLSIVLWTAGRYDQAFAVGKLGMDLIGRFGAHSERAAVEFTFAAFAMPWRLPLAEAIELLGAGQRWIELGDPGHAGYGLVFQSFFREIHGAPISELQEALRRNAAMGEQYNLGHLQLWTEVLERHLRWWSGASASAGEADLDFAAFDAKLVAMPDAQSMVVLHRVYELERRYWSGDYVGALALAEEIRPMLPAIPANIVGAHGRSYMCLAALATTARPAWLEDDEALLATYAAHCPANFGHVHALVRAERARAGGDMATALACYDAAARDAGANGFVKIETLAHELSSRFWRERDKPEFASIHLAKARDLCLHRGALRRGRELELRRRQLGAGHDERTTIRTTSAISSTMDFAALVRASHAMASDVVLDSLLVTIMDIIVENAGAEFGAIVLSTSGAPLVHASKRHGAPTVVTAGTALAEASIAETIVRFAIRTSELVVLADATKDRTFRNDAYVRARQPRSIVCIPIVRQQRMIGTVYLENNLVAGAFTVERLDALCILIGQLAISIENAQMFSRLEELVEQRTRALSQANADLKQEAIARARVESELRLGQKLQSVGQLAAGVAHEINTPVQFIGDSIEFLRETVVSLVALVERVRPVVPADLLQEAAEELEYDYLREKGPDACDRIRDGARRVGQIVHALKSFSHPDSTEQQPADLNGAIENTLVVARSEYRTVADVQTELAELPFVLCHIGEINQVLLNLVVNSAHAIPADRRGVITLRTRVDGDDVVIEVSDTGGGIPEAIRDRVFDPFFTTKPVGKGTGQGLALARTAVVDRHGGSLTFETSARGTTFFVRLPIAGKPVELLRARAS